MTTKARVLFEGKNVSSEIPFKIFNAANIISGVADTTEIYLTWIV